MDQKALPRPLANLLYALENGLLDDELGRASRVIVEVGIDDDFAKEEIDRRVLSHKIAQAFAGPIARPRLDTGDLVIGLDPDRNLLSTFLQYLNGHSLTLGNTGAAKTTKTRFLVLQIAPAVKGLWLFDLRKREFAVLRPYLQASGIELLIVPTRSLRINPLQVPYKTHPSAFAPRAADILVHVLNLPARATKLLHSTILRLYRKWNVFAGALSYPTLFHVHEAVAKDKTANAPARQAILDSLDPVLASLGPEVLGYHLGWSTRELARRHIAFDLSGAAEVDKDLILNFLLESEFTSRMAQQISNPKMDMYIACDEAASLVSASQGSQGLSQRLGLIRGSGIGMDLSVQSADIAQSVLSNTANKFIGRCGSARDYDLMGGAMGLNAQQRQWMSNRLRPGWFVAQLGEGNGRVPFLMEVPELRFPRRLDVSEWLGDLTALPTIPAHLPVANSPALPPARQPSLSSPQALPPPNVPGPDLRFLRAVVQHPGLPSHKYAKLAGMNSRKAVEIRRDLVAQNFLREHSVNTGARGRNAIVLEPLPSALEALRVAGLSTPGGGP